METQLLFKRVGDYSMQQAGSEDECCECKKVDFADILVDITKRHDFLEKKYICVKCLLKNWFNLQSRKEL